MSLEYLFHRSIETVSYTHLAENVEFIDLGSKQEQKETDHELAVIAIPVFGGRLPAFASEKLKKVNGCGRKAVTLAVYGTCLLYTSRCV